MRDTQTSYVLSFRQLDLEITATATSALAAAAVERFDARMLSNKPMRQRDVNRLAEVFVAHVEAWDLRTAAGRPLPVTVEAFLMQHRDEVVAPVLRQWAALVRQPVPPELAEAEETVEQEIPEETVAGIAVSELEASLAATSLTTPGDNEYVAAADPPPVVEPEVVAEPELVGAE